jgi:hypothetical protein
MPRPIIYKSRDYTRDVEAINRLRVAIKLDKEIENENRRHVIDQIDTLINSLVAIHNKRVA